MTLSQSLSPAQLKAGLIKASSLAWVLDARVVTENQRILEFDKHRYLIDLYADESADIAVRKSAQNGGSVCFILKSLHAAAYKGDNVIYVLPTQNIVKDFVEPKVNPLISSNPKVAALISKDSVSLKQIGKRYIYFKGASSEREAIAISGDLLVLDELDRMPDMGVVNTYDSRLQASLHPRRWRLSNPSGVGQGIDQAFYDGNQMHWFVRCRACGHEWFIDDLRGELNHYLDDERLVFACGKCHEPLSDHDRQMGRWVAAFPNRERHSYWLSQLMVPYVSAARIVEQRNESSTEFYHNFVLGKAYTPSDLVISRETILRACMPSVIPKVGVAMGVDQKASEMEYVAATAQGIFAYGRAKSWEEIEALKLQWGATLVMDAMPYNTGPRLLSQKYPDAYMCYFKDSRGMDILDWKQGTVYADRTRLLDLVAKEITDCKLVFRMHPYDLEEYIADWQNIYRTVVEEADGRQKVTWLKKDNKESDFSFATAYMRIALSQQLAHGDLNLVEPSPLEPNKTDAILPDGTTLTTLNESVADTFAEM
jgi:hypothetical protein